MGWYERHETKMKYVDAQLNNSIQGLTLYGNDDIPSTIKRLKNDQKVLDELLR